MLIYYIEVTHVRSRLLLYYRMHEDKRTEEEMRLACEGGSDGGFQTFPEASFGRKVIDKLHLFGRLGRSFLQMLFSSPRYSLTSAQALPTTPQRVGRRERTTSCRPNQGEGSEDTRLGITRVVYY